jgi:formylglycine-generating enzyme required for sulfatase activity
VRRALIAFLLVNACAPSGRDGDDHRGMVKVPAAPFVRGNSDGSGRALPRTTIDLPTFWIDRTEVTNAAWDRCVAAGGCDPVDWAGCDTLAKKDPTLVPDGIGPSHPLRAPEHPVVCINVAAADRYCRWAGKRLPTETEWEKAARGVDERLYPWGNEWDPKRLNFGDEPYGSVDGWAFTSPVGTYAPDGPYGTQDTAGNVWEWTSSPYEADAMKHITRGGGWAAGPIAFTTFHRAPQTSTRAAINFGFRCVDD